MNDSIEKVLISQETMEKCVKELGARITEDYKGKSPVFVGVLKGCFMFMADLVRNVDLNCSVDFMAVSSYGRGTTSTGAVEITQDLKRNIEGEHVIIVEDILDSGITLGYLLKYFEGRKPASVEIVTLLDKPGRRANDVSAKYVGFSVPDEFVVGYGLDYAEQYRNLPYIGVLKRSVYET